MTSNNKTLLAILVLILIAGGFYFVTHTTPATPTEPTPVVSGLKTTTDSATDISFSYPEKLPYTYISTVDWPPKIQLINKAFTCTPAGSEIVQAGKTESITINGRTYCRTIQSEGAAGSIYTNYAYAFADNNNTIILTFTLRFVQCANYPEPKQTECSAERASFNVEPVVDQIRQSITFGTPINNSVGYVSGHITIGPFCPVEQVGHPCPTPPEAYSSREVVIYQSDGLTVAKTGKIDANGNYKISLSPGNYFAQVSPAGIGPGEKKPFIIKSSQTTVVDFNIDTGIR